MEERRVSRVTQRSEERAGCHKRKAVPASSSRNRSSEGAKTLRLRLRLGCNSLSIFLSLSFSDHFLLVLSIRISLCHHNSHSLFILFLRQPLSHRRRSARRRRNSCKEKCRATSPTLSGVCGQMASRGSMSHLPCSLSLALFFSLPLHLSLRYS